MNKNKKAGLTDREQRRLQQREMKKLQDKITKYILNHPEIWDEDIGGHDNGKSNI